MHVLLVGGTGFIGEALARTLHDRDHEVSVLARSPDDTDLPHEVRRVRGDVTAYDSIESAFENVDAVVNLVSLSPLFRPRGGNQRHFDVHLGGTENVVRAASKHDVSKFIQVSALGANADGDTAYIRSKGQAETVVRESDLSWVILRPSVVFGDGDEFVGFTKKLAPPYVTPLPGGGSTRFQPIWVGDFARIIAATLEEDDHVGEIYEIGGPDVLTLAEVAELAHAAAGRPVNVVSIPMWLAKLGLSLLELVPRAPMGTDQYRSLQFDNTTTENDVAVFGLEPDELTSLAEYFGVEADVDHRS